MGVLLITHDLGVVAQWADRVAVMYGGEQVEEGATQSLFQAPDHPYTQGLMGASLHGGNTIPYRKARLPDISTDKAANTVQTHLHLHKPDYHTQNMSERNND